MTVSAISAAMERVFSDIFAPTHLGYAVIWARLLAAVIFGGLIGFERELKARPAGLRTNALVALAAATFAILSIEVVRSDAFAQDTVRVDPLRVIEAVTAGVAFLAAGFIVLQRGEIQGLTTGAGIWLSAALGLSIGFGYWSIALPALVIGAVVLVALRHMESLIGLKD
jgi:putative Mg2+ transporter-C (MgtC) family protein